MGFLNKSVLKSVLQKKVASAAVETHPLLKECDVPLNVRQAYLQGCVLAVLERDNGEVTDAARREITRLGLSLQMTEGDIYECISVASGLNAPEVQDEFLSEFFSILAGDVYPRFFMSDFEKMISGGGALTDSAKETLDCFGVSLTNSDDWRLKIGAYERLLKVVVSQLNCSPEKIKPGTVLIDDLDGVETSQLMQAIEREFGICIPKNDFPKLRTVECACHYLGG